MLPDSPSATTLSRPLVVSAPGKVILFGEHSVVYGKRSLAFSLGLRTELCMSPARGVVELHLPEICVEKSWDLCTLKPLWEKMNKKDQDKIFRDPKFMSESDSLILRTFLGITDKEDLQKGELGMIAFLYLYTTVLSSPVPFSIKVGSQMPVGAGLGSSAAYGVCLASALTWISGHLKFIKDSTQENNTQISKESLNHICEWAFCCEQIMHGTPSGIDNAICTYGGCVSFKAGKIDNTSSPPLTIMLVNTRVTRNTKTLVAGVKEKYRRHHSIMEPIFASMDHLAESALQILNDMKANGISCEVLNQKFFQLLELIDMNQCLLSAIGVSHPSLDELVATAKDHGFHAKLTGAGGGGFGIVLLQPTASYTQIDTCKKALEAKGFESWITELGGQGLTFSQI